MELSTTLLVLTVTFFILIWLWLKNNYNFWKSRGVTVPPYSYFFGNLGSVIMSKSSFPDSTLEIYNYLKSRNCNYGGMYFMHSPFFVPVHIDLVKSVLQTDFQHFFDRGIYHNEKADPLSAHLFSLEGMKWKSLRSKLSPTFSSGKIKTMFQTVLDCTKSLNKAILRQGGIEVDTKDVLGRFTTDIIGSCAFGLECNSLENPDSLFREKGKRFIQHGSFVDHLKEFAGFAMPGFLKFFNVKVVPLDLADFFMGIVKDTVKYREDNRINRKDFMNLLIQLKNRGALVDDENIFEESPNKSENSLTIEEVAAQAFIFFLAGFETSSSAMTFACYELAKNEDIQVRVRNEIEQVMEKYDGKLTYAAVGEMQYLEQVIEETLRKYPALPFLTRICTKDYKVPGSDLILEKGQRVFIPAFGIHYDPEFYPDPDKFDPSRFTEENKRKLPACSYIPFGEGPRICIGVRFGMLQTKVGIITLLLNYNISVNKRTKEPLQFDSETLIVSTKDGIWLDFKKLSDETVQLF